MDKAATSASPSWALNFQDGVAGRQFFKGVGGGGSFRCSINKAAVSLTTAVGTWFMGIYIVLTFIAHIVSMIVASEQGYSGFQVTGMIEWGQKSILKTIRGPKLNPQKIPCQISEP